MQDPERTAHGRSAHPRLAVAAITAALIGVFGAGGAYAVTASQAPTTTSHPQNNCDDGHGHSDSSTACTGQPPGDGDDETTPPSPVDDEVTCTAGGLAGDTIADQLYFGATGQASPPDQGPLSGAIHDNVEPQAGPGAPLFHEIACGIAVFDNGGIPPQGGPGGGLPDPGDLPGGGLPDPGDLPGGGLPDPGDLPGGGLPDPGDLPGGGLPDPGDLPGGGLPDPGDLPIPTPGGDNTGDFSGTCSTGGFQGGATVADQLSGQDLNETGPISGVLHTQVEGAVPAEAAPLATAVHEISCGAAFFESNAPTGP